MNISKAVIKFFWASAFEEWGSCSDFVSGKPMSLERHLGLMTPEASTGQQRQMPHRSMGRSEPGTGHNGHHETLRKYFLLVL